MAEIANLLDNDGCKFKANIYGDPVSGEICVQGDNVFLLHNNTTHCGGIPARGMRGYKASWNVHRGTADELISEKVKDFELVVSNSALESELESCSTPEKEVPRDIPGVHKFKVGDKIRIKAGVKSLIYNGAIRGDARDNGEVRGCEMFDRDKKCLRVNVKFIDGRNYTMSEDELEFLPADFHMYVTGDIAEFEDKLWIVIRHDSTGINMEKEDGAKAIILNHKFDTLTLRGHTDKMPIISVGDYLKAERIETWSIWNTGKSPIGIIPPMATVKVTAIGKFADLASNPYRTFSFEWRGDEYDDALGKQNIYTPCDSREFVEIPGIRLGTSTPNAKLDVHPDPNGPCKPGLHLIDVAGLNPCMEMGGAPYVPEIQWHISPRPEMRYSGPMSEGRARDLRDREAYEHLRERGRAAYEARMRYGGMTRTGSPYMYEPFIMGVDPIKKEVDPKTDRESYLIAGDVFTKPSPPDKPLQFKKEKKFSL